MSTWAIVGIVLLAIPLLVFAVLVPFYLTIGLTEVLSRVAAWITDITGAFGLPGRLGAMVLAIPKFGIMMFKNLRRSLVRTSLTYLATLLGVIVVAMIWSVLAFLDKQMADKTQDVKVIVTEKFQLPSQMPPSYEANLAAEATGLPKGIAADPKKDLMSWTFVGASTDPNVRTLETILFFFALEPKTMLTMMEDLDENTIGREDRKRMERSVAEMGSNVRGVIVGEDRLKAINKKVGDRITVYCFNYKDIEFEVEIVGTFPRGRYDMSSAMNIEYFRRKLDAYERAKGQRHPLAEKSMNLYWARFPEKEGYENYAERIGQPGRFSSPAVKAEMYGAAISSFLDAYKDIFKAMRFLMAPLILGVIVLVVAISYSIGVRERQKELAIMKVLGFAPWQILVLILGEAIIVGAMSGAIATTTAWWVINVQMGGFALPIGFFGKFKVVNEALWWGPALGAFAAVVGSFFPALTARRVRVTEVFSKIA